MVSRVMASDDISPGALADKGTLKVDDFKHRPTWYISAAMIGR